LNSKDFIKLNNDMRDKLSEENKEIYEDMLVYIRLNGNKSEQQTEEVLFELLEHLLEAQKEGKTARDVFGNDLRKYCDELIAEIPGEEKSFAFLFGAYIVIYFLGILSTFHGIGNFALHQFFDVGSNDFTFSIGSGITVVIIDLLILSAFIIIVLKWLKNSTFKEKKPNKWVEFLQLWFISMIFIGAAVVVPIIMPSFGSEITIPVLSFAVVGIIFFFISFMLNKKFRITK
jgi:DNA-binding ferritin-like protein (Dps family)